MRTGATAVLLLILGPALAADPEAVEVTGYLQFDAANQFGDATELADRFETRRARIGLQGEGEWWAYELEIEATETEEHPRWKDAWVGLRPDAGDLIQLGQFKEPFSLEELTSARHSTFLERGLPNLFAPERHLGVGWRHAGGRWSLAAGAFGEEINSDVWQGSRGFGARATWAPLLDGQQAVHLGIALNRRDPGEDHTLRLRARPESHLAPRLLDTGTLTEVEHLDLLGLEAAALLGPWSLQGEYMAARVERSAEEPLFSGWYLYGSWFVTGESRRYRADEGSFGGIKPKSPGGAWELALRVSGLDLSDAGIEGGEATDLTFGLNWYPNRHIRLMLNHVMVDTHPNAKGKDDDPRLWLFRTQFSL